MRAPVWLPEHLKDDFTKLGKELIAAGLLAKLDIDILARYVMSRDAWVAAHLKARGRGWTWTTQRESGSWARVARTYFDQCQQCANSMGLTISSRCRLVVPKSLEDRDEGRPDEQNAARAGGKAAQCMRKIMCSLLCPMINKYGFLRERDAARRAGAGVSA